VEKPAFQQISRTPTRKQATTARGFLLAAFLLLALVTTPATAHPQGCTQCLDNTAATPPKTQAAYRRAVILLTLTAGGLFVTTLILFKRHR
jgi:hypothetical protein